jgi:hypothetical protein
VKYRTAETVYWTDPDLKKVVRLKVLTDPGFPYLDVSYCYGELRDGTPVRVSLPFYQLPKRGAGREIVRHAKVDGVYAVRLGILDALTET